MKKFLTSIAISKYTHLCLGLVMLYGVSSSVTSTSRVEKIADSLTWYCLGDYEVRVSSHPGERMVATFYREEYSERLDSLASGVLDWRDEKQIQAFLLPEGFLYDVWEEEENTSYLLAQITSKGRHETEVPEKVAFDYYILGKKKIIPLPEYREGPQARIFVSAGDAAIYIHRDYLERLLQWYFDFLWKTKPRQPGAFCIHGKAITKFLYHDLQPVCEDIFVKKLIRDKKTAQKYFIEEGFRVFLPTMLAMGARMAADQGSVFRPGERYLRALFTGLSLQPNYTMFYLSKHYHHSPATLKFLDEFRKRIDMTDPGEITLDQISRVAQEFLEKMDESLNQNK